MPGKSQARNSAPLSTPQAAQVTSPTGPTSGGRGNLAAQDRLAAADPADDAQSALRQNVRSASMSVRGRLPANLSLGKAGDNEIKTDEATGFELGVARWGLWARFHPALLVKPGSFWSRMATSGITVSQLNFDFQSGQATLDVDTGWTGDVLDVFMDLKSGIERKFAAAIRGGMPQRFQQGGYDPFTDPELSTRLSSIVNAISGAFPAAGSGGGLAEKITEPEICATVSPLPMEFPLEKGMVLKLSERASLSITAKMNQTLGQALARPKVRRLEVQTDGVTLEHKTAGILGGLDIHSLAFGPDLSLVDFQYTLGIESGVGLLKLLGAMAQVRTGQDLGVRDLNTPEMEQLRADVDKQAREKLPAMIREQLRRQAVNLPALPLLDMFEGGQS